MSAPFTFAGFTFPRAVAMLPKGNPASRLAKRRASGPSPCGPYQTAPAPNSSGAFFYLESDFAPGMRWQWADECEGVRINHTGWHSEPYGDGDSIRGIVVRLPKARGFLSGWSMGEGMASELETGRVYDDESSAAYAADSIAERVAEREREYQTAWQAGTLYANAGEEIATQRKRALAILAERRAVRGMAEAPALCAAIRERLESILDHIRDARAERAKLAEGDAPDLMFWPGEQRLRDAFNEGASATVLA